jgi:hypothetical protein
MRVPFAHAHIPIRPELSLSFTDSRVRPRTARSAHALVRPVSSIPSLSLPLSILHAIPSLRT